MRHRISGKQLCRDGEHRRAMLRNLAAGLFEHGQIETTLPKAKAVQPFVEKIITIAKKGTFTARRQIVSRLTDRSIHSWVADPSVPDSRKNNQYFDLPDASDIQLNRYGEVRKAPRLVHHVMTKIAPLFADRDGDRDVDFQDFLFLPKAFGSKRGEANFDDAFDYDGNGIVDFADFLQFRTRFGRELASPI